MHGEATFVRAYAPASVLDAGCGTGRVAIELARHGIEVVGVDVDAAAVGLELGERFATWARQPFGGGDYAISVHRRP